MRRSAVPLSYRVILVGMIGGAYLISVDHSVFIAFRLLGGVSYFGSGRLNPIGWPTLRACGILTDSAEIREDAGDYWTAPSWTIEKERTTVAAVWDEQGNEYPEIAEALQVLLN